MAMENHHLYVSTINGHVHYSYVGPYQRVIDGQKSIH